MLGLKLRKRKLILPAASAVLCVCVCVGEGGGVLLSQRDHTEGVRKPIACMDAKGGPGKWYKPNNKPHN
jgi:hypothetical protein